MKEVKQIASNIYANYLVNHASVHYGGDVSKITSGELSELSVLAMQHAEVLDVLNEFDHD